MSEENLDPLITECPNCDTRFRVTESQLQIAGGRVRCGACLVVFDGTVCFGATSLSGPPSEGACGSRSVMVIKDSWLVLEIRYCNISGSLKRCAG